MVSSSSITTMGPLVTLQPFMCPHSAMITLLPGDAVATR
jgi:hypothetical protein